MKARTTRLLSCATLSLIVHAGLAATFIHAVKPTPVMLEIVNPIQVSLVDEYSIATGEKNDDSVSSGSSAYPAREVVSESDHTSTSKFNVNLIEHQMAVAIDLQFENSEPLETEFEIIEDSDFLLARYPIVEFEVKAAPQTKSHETDSSINKNLESVVSKLEKKSTGRTFPVIKDAVPVKFDNKTNKSENQPLVSINHAAPPSSIETKFDVQTVDIYSHTEQVVAVREETIHEKQLSDWVFIEPAPEFLPESVSDYRSARVDSSHTNNASHVAEADKNPVPSDFDSEFVRWAQSDLEFTPDSQLVTNPDTKIALVEEAQNTENFKSISTFEESLSTQFHEPHPVADSPKENSQQSSQPSSNSDNNEKSDHVQLVANTATPLTTQELTNHMIEQQLQHTDSKPSRKSTVESPALIHSQKLASIAGTSVKSSPKYGIEGLSNPAPRYPYLSRANGEEGKVVLQVVVDRNGIASEITVVESSGYRRLDKAARLAVKKWKFQPAQKGGIKVQGMVQVPISFILRDS